ncbi:MAG: hypothetical protein ACOC3D_02920 [Pseudomonadota bacterium]
MPVVLGLIAVLLATTAPVAAQPPDEAPRAALVAAPEVRFGRHPGFRRVALEWAEPMAVEVRSAASPVEIVFDRPPGTDGDFDLAALTTRLAPVLRHAELAGTTLRLYLRPGVRLSHLVLADGRILALDFSDPVEAAAADTSGPALPPRRREGPLPARDDPEAREAGAMSRELPTVHAITDPLVERARAMPWNAADRTARAAPQASSAERTADRWVPTGPDLPPADDDASATVVGPEALPEPTIDPEPITNEPIDAPPAETEATADRTVEPLPPPPTAAARAAPETAQDASPPADEVTSKELPAAGLVAEATADGWRFRTRPARPAAVWRRGGEVWVVIPFPEGGAATTEVRDPRIVPQPHETAWVFRLDVDPAVPLSIDRDGQAWLLRSSATPSATHLSTENVDDLPRIRLDDPWLATTLQVVPVDEPGAGIERAHREGARAWLPTLQGAVFHEPDGEAAARSAPALPPELPPRPEAGPLLGLAGATVPPEALRGARLDLERALFEDPVGERRLALVRFLLGQVMPFDALAVLDAATAPEADPELAERLLALRGVARILAGRVEDGLADLPDPADHDDPELWLWRAVAAGLSGRLEEGGAAFARSGQVWREYPLPLRRTVALHAGRTALALDASQVTLALLDQLADAPGGRDDGALRLLRAEALARRGERGDAEERLVHLANDADLDVARRARFVHARLQRDLWDGVPAEAVARLEADLPAWRGRPDEAAVWRLVASQRAAAGDGLGALEAWAEARRIGPSPAPDDRTAERAVLVGLIEGEDSETDALSAAVTAVHRFEDLLPEGVERARLLQALAARVAEESEALHVADSLLTHALAEPVPPETEEELRLALAELRLQRHVPSQALDALEPLAVSTSPAVEALRRRAARELGGEAADIEREALDGVAADSVADALAAARELLEADPGTGPSER